MNGEWHIKTKNKEFLAFSEKTESHFRFKVDPNYLKGFLTDMAREQLAEQGDIITFSKIEQIKEQILGWLDEDTNYAAFLFNEARENHKVLSYRYVDLSDYQVEFDLAEDLSIKTYVQDVEYTEENQTEVYGKAEKQIEERLNIKFADFASDYEISCRILSEIK